MSLPSTRRDTSAAFVANVSRQSRTERRVPLREGAASMEILIEGLDVPSYVADIAERKRHSFVACRLPEVAVFGALLGAAYAAVRKRERHVETRMRGHPWPCRTDVRASSGETSRPA